MSDHGRIEGLISHSTFAPATTFTDTGGAGSITIPSFDYFMSSIATGGVRSFLDELANQLNINATLNGTYTVTGSFGEGGTGKVTIAADEAFTVTWGNADLRDILGFDVDLVSATSHTGNVHARMVWLPDAPHITVLGADDDGFSESNVRVIESSDGTVYYSGERDRTVRQILWQAVSRSRARLRGQTIPNESFEQFFIDAIQGSFVFAKQAGLLRVYFDADVDATFFTYKMASNLSIIPTVPMLDNSNALWNIQLERLVI